MVKKVFTWMAVLSVYLMLCGSNLWASEFPKTPEGLPPLARGLISPFGIGMLFIGGFIWRIKAKKQK